MAEHNDLGKWGEDEAAMFLERKGYVICERDWKLEHRDLDIVAVTPDAQTLVIVEVKTRSSSELQEPEEAVDSRKKRNLAVAADAYIKMHHVSQEIRFDIVSVVGKKGNLESINHIVEAFNPMLVL